MGQLLAADTGLVDIELSKPDQKQQEFHLTFVYENRAQSELDITTIETHTETIGMGLEQYAKGAVIYANENTQVVVCEGWSGKWGEVVIKTCSRGALFELNQFLREGVYQARVAHPNSCRVIDISLSKVRRTFELSLVLEKFPTSLQRAIRERSQPYHESELLQCLCEASSALLHAKNVGIAHRDLKPANILISTEGHYKLGDFGCAWELKLRSVTADQVGTFGFMAPEVRLNAFNRPFPADVYSLGVVILCMATSAFRDMEFASMHSTDLQVLSDVIAESIGKIHCSDMLKGLLIAMTAVDPGQRVSIEEVVERAKEIESRAKPQSPPLILPGIHLKTLFCHSPHTSQVSTVSLSISFDIWAVFCLLSSDLLLCIGGPSRITASAYILTVSSGALQAISPMSRPRAGPGLLKHGNYVYAFGGGNGSRAMNSCEKLNVRENTWGEMKDMRYPRWCFTPCEFDGDVYLLDVWHSHKVFERWNIRRNAFQIITVSLAGFEDWGSVSFVYEGELVVVSYGKQIGRWKINAESAFRISEIPMKSGKSGRSLIPPVQSGNSVFWTRVMSGDLVTFHLDSFTITDS